MSIRDYEDHRVMRRLRAEDQAQELYWRTCDEIEAEMRAEWEAEFDSFPFEPNEAEIHRQAIKRIKQLTGE
jgi:hypothetical protein